MENGRSRLLKMQAALLITSFPGLHGDIPEISKGLKE